MIIDADGHVIETEAVFEKYLAPEFQDRRPELVTNRQGWQYWLIEGALVPKPAGSGPGTSRGFVTPGAHRGFKDLYGLQNVSGRLADLDVEGIDIQVMYPTLMLGACFVREAKLAAAMCRAYNTWVHDSIGSHRDRLKAVAVVPLQDPQAAIVELRHAVTELGMVGAVIPGFLPDRRLDHPSLRPFFAEAARLNTLLGVHAVTGCYDIPGQDRFDDFWSAHMVAMPFAVFSGLVSLMRGGIFTTHPKLRFAFLEIGCGWAPYWIERFDEHYEKHEMYGDLHRLVPELAARPSTVLTRDNFFVSCEPDEKMLPAFIQLLGDDNVVFASDYPHGDCRFPECINTVRRRSDLSEDSKRKVLGENAARMYNLG